MGIINKVLKSKVINCKNVRLMIDGEYLDELTFSVSRDFIKLKIVGSFELFLMWTSKLNNSNKIKIKHEPSGLVIKDYGLSILEDAVIECEDNNRIEITLVWGL